MENNHLNFDFKDGTLRISLIGEIDRHSAVAVRSTVDDKINTLHPTKIIIDLSQIDDFADSSGLVFVVGRYQLAQNLGAELVVEKANKKVRSYFKDAGLGKLMKIVK